jgi:hypothetical protein
MLNQLKARTQAQNPANQKDSLIDYTYDPARQNNPPYKTIYQPTPSANSHVARMPDAPDSYSRGMNTSLKHSQQQTTTTHPANVDSQTRTRGLATHPTIQHHTATQMQIRENEKKQEILERVATRIHTHFRAKYPALIDASGFSPATITKIIDQISSRTPNGQLDEKGISKVIDVIDMKFKTTSHSENRNGVQWDMGAFTTDTESKIPMDKYLENYTNKVAILLDSSDKAIEAELPKEMAPVNDTKPIEKSDPFSEDFPIRDREKQTDMMIPEVREYDYYITIDSKDRDPVKYPEPNHFVIDFSPAPPAPGETRKGYIDRGLGNVKSCELMNVIVRDVSDQPDSSDAGSASYPYLILQFDELQNNYFGTNNNLSRSFAILTEYSLIGKYRYYRIIGDTAENTVMRVYNPRINLNKITTNLMLPNGTPFNFGSAFTNDTSNSCITFSFRMTTIQKNLATQFINKATY